MSADLVREREKDCERQSRKDGPRGGQPLPCCPYNKTDSRLPCLSDLLPVCNANFQSDITATFLLFNSHFPFFFLRNMQNKQIPSTAFLVIPRNISCHVISCGLPHWFPTIATGKVNFLKTNKFIYSILSNKCHIL